MDDLPGVVRNQHSLHFAVIQCLDAGNHIRVILHRHTGFRLQFLQSFGDSFRISFRHRAHGFAIEVRHIVNIVFFQAHQGHGIGNPVGEVGHIVKYFIGFLQIVCPDEKAAGKGHSHKPADHAGGGFPGEFEPENDVNQQGNSQDHSTCQEYVRWQQVDLHEGKDKQSQAHKHGQHSHNTEQPRTPAPHGFLFLFPYWFSHDSPPVSQLFKVVNIKKQGFLSLVSSVVKSSAGNQQRFRLLLHLLGESHGFSVSFSAVSPLFASSTPFRLWSWTQEL